MDRVLLLCCSAVLAQDEARRLAARAERSAALIDDTRELCDRIGGRPTGSQACDRAVHWAAKKFREAGIEKIAVESFTVPRLWLGGTGRGFGHAEILGRRFAGAEFHTPAAFYGIR